MIYRLRTRDRWVLQAGQCILLASLVWAQSPPSVNLPVPSAPTVQPAAPPAVVVPKPPQPAVAAPAPNVATNAPAQPSGPDPAVTQLDFANGLFSRQFYDLALVEYLKFKEKFDNHPLADEAYYRMAECYREMKQLDGAREAFKTVTRRWPGSEYSGRAHFRLAEIAYEAKEYAKAVPLFMAAMHQTRDESVRVTSSFYLARCQLETDQGAAALENFRRVTKSKVGGVFIPYAESAMAGIYLKQGDPQQALAHYEVVLNLKAGAELTEEALYQVGALKLAQKQYPAAASSFRRFVKEFPHSHSVNTAAVGLIRSLFQQGKRQESAVEARQWYDKAPKEDQTELAMMVALKLRDDKAFKEAADWFAKANTPEAKVELVRCSFLAGDHARTVEMGRALIQSEPNSPHLESMMLLVAESLEAQKQWESAGAAYRALLERFPKSHWAADAIWRGAECWQQAKKLDEAVKELERFANEFPKDARNEAAWCQLASSYGQLDKTEAMVGAFEKLLSLYPQSAHGAEARYWVGAQLLTQSQWAKAAEQLEGALSLRPEENRDRACPKLVVAYYHLENVQKTADQFQILCDHGQGKVVAPEIVAWLGEKMLAAEKPEKALKYLNQALEATTDPALRTAINETVAQAYVKLGQWEKAAAFCRDIIESEGNSKRGMGAAINLSEALVRMRAYKDARETLEKLMENYPEGAENARLRMLMGDLQSGLGNFQQAARFYMTVATLHDDPKITPVALERAAAAFDAADRTGDAVQARRELDQRFPTYRLTPHELPAGLAKPTPSSAATEPGNKP